MKQEEGYEYVFRDDDGNYYSYVNGELEYISETECIKFAEWCQRFRYISERFVGVCL